jgi:hypothetical protein
MKSLSGGIDHSNTSLGLHSTKRKRTPIHEVGFATLELPGGGVQTVEELANVLQPYLRLPDELLKCLEEDRVNNRGNVVRHWAVPDVQQ